MSSKTKNEVLRSVVLILSILLTLHFAFALVMWFMRIWTTHSKSGLQWIEPLHLTISVTLMSISVASFIRVIRKKQGAIFLLLFTILLSICCFIYETRYSNSAGIIRPIIVSGEEPYQGIGYRYNYINWMWYEKDVIRSNDFTEEKVFHHLFGIRPKGYISSSTLTYIGEQETVVNKTH